MKTKAEHSENISTIVEQAQEAFWAKVVELVPEAESGDLSPHATYMLENASSNAVSEWINNNVPEPKFKHVAQITVDVAYNEYDEIDSFKNSIEKINENSEFEVEVMGTPCAEDMTDQYKDTLKDERITG